MPSFRPYFLQGQVQTPLFWQDKSSAILIMLMPLFQSDLLTVWKHHNLFTSIIFIILRERHKKDECLSIKQFL